MHKSWNEIDVDMIVRSFKKCGISNALDGTEDDALYEDELPVNNTSENDHESDNENADDRSCWDIYDDTLTAQEMNELYAAQSEDDESDQNDI